MTKTEMITLLLATGGMLGFVCGFVCGITFAIRRARDD